jgi:enediyne biosynthesis protein E4
MRKYSFVFVMIIGVWSCSSKKQVNYLFDTLGEDSTGIHFENKITPTPAFNLFSYMYYYNGAGTGAGDFNNDGLIDLYFASNQGKSAMYINKGGMRFEDITTKTGIIQDSAWNTGVSVVDINADGLLDIYLCCVGNYKVLKGRNRLLICTGIDKGGIPHYEEKAASYGLDFSGFSTQAAFLDYDADGDLDMFLLNHSVNHDGNYAPRKSFINTYDSLAGQRLYRNDKGKFINVTASTGINGSRIGYGLGVVVSDINMDGWPDIYVGNDFHEDDYLYINQKNGRFLESGRDALTHTSEFSMGVDAADIDNDAFPEIISMDMLPYQPYMLKRSLSEDDYNLFNQKIAYGYSYQYARNNLQYNLKNGKFSEIGQYANVFATDWSWAALWMDFNNDGNKDLFVSNGIPKRMNDMDYINFVSGQEIQQKLRSNTIGDKDLALTNKFPEIKIPNQFFVNTGKLKFENYTDSIRNNLLSFSNGALYADLDNDGDLDVVVNNINDKAFIYSNNSNKSKTTTDFTSITLKGKEGNINALGAKILVYAQSQIYSYENNPIHGFQSSMAVPIHIGLQNIKVDSAIVVWLNNEYQKIDIKRNTRTVINYTPTNNSFDYTKLTQVGKNSTPAFLNITSETGINHTHIENPFNEFDRELLMPRMVSTEGPAVAVADINHDGLEDIFIGAAKSYQSAVYLQQKTGKFTKLLQPAMVLDSMWEAVDAQWIDCNNDTHLDLVIATGGNEYYGEDEHLQPLLYLNDGKGNLSRKKDAFPNIFITQSCVKLIDINSDGNIDLFFGGRAIPWNYGQTAPSYLLLNDGKGNYKDVTSTWCKGLAEAGMVTDAVWVDINNDKKLDLVLSTEWGTIDAYVNDGKKLEKQSLSNVLGLWQHILPVDIDKDGDIDFVAGNYGLNSRLKASEKEPVRMYLNDFDDNGMKEQLITYYVQGEEIPFSSKMQLERRMPALKKKFLYAENFAKAPLTEIFSQSKLNQSVKKTITSMSSILLINNGKGKFTEKELPMQAQWSTIRTGIVGNFHKDGRPTILLAGNFSGYNVELGKQDANYGIIITANTNQQFTSVQNINGFPQGEVRKIVPIQIGNTKAMLVVRNNASLVVLAANK